MSRVVVVGGGIAGLAAAYALRRDGPPDLEITVLEGDRQLGGKLRVSEVGGLPVDEGAEMFLVRVPEAVELARAVGLGGAVTHPVTTAAGVVIGGAARPLPTGTVLGVPADLAALRAAGVLTAAGLSAVAAEVDRPGEPVTGDVAVGGYVRRRLGPEVVDRLVDPLLGGVYAGRADRLSLRATMPALARQLAAAPDGSAPSLVAAARAARAAETPAIGPGTAGAADPVARAADATASAGAAAPSTAAAPATAPATAAAAAGAAVASAAAGAGRPGAGGPGAGVPAAQGGPGAVGTAGPVFGTLPGGMGVLPGAVAAAAAADVRLGLPARRVERGANGAGFRVVAGAVPAPVVVEADAVVVAVPASKAAPLLAGLAGLAPSVSAELAGIEYASIAIVTLGYRAGDTGRLVGSGLLVPAIEGGAVKAVTYSSAKWPHLAGGELAVLRASIGRQGDEQVLQRPDAELVALAGAEVAALTGLPRPVLGRVSRWGGALPQYGVGHVDRVARIRAGVAGVPGLAVCGAAYEGVGVPACIRSGYAAAATVLRHLAQQSAPAQG